MISWDESTTWALNQIYRCFDDAKRLREAEDKRLDPPAEVKPMNQSKACYEGEHEGCDWDNTGACICECHFDELSR